MAVNLGHMGPELRASIRERDHNRCAKCGATKELQVHHRIRRSQGGKDLPSNLITLCAYHHRWVHEHPYKARDGGWLLLPSDTPHEVSVKHVLWPSWEVRLTDELTFEPVIDEEKADDPPGLPR